MNVKEQVWIMVLFVMIGSCEGVDRVYLDPEPEDLTACDSKVISSGKYYEIGQERYLWAGQDTATHFEITDWDLNACNLKFGLGRESFNALTAPEYEPLSTTSKIFPDTSRAILIRSGDLVKVFPLATLRQFETVNETVDGIPVAIIYCYIVDLATVFNREICGEVLTFGVSGYTYVQDGQESFLLWDRNSESLWWPISEIAVSGPYKGVVIPRLSYSLWGISRMSQIKKSYPDALLLKESQPRKKISVVPVNGC